MSTHASTRLQRWWRAFRSAITGRFVKQIEAADAPATTVAELRARKRAAAVKGKKKR